MAIKWNDRWVITSTYFGNQIIIGKLDAKSKYPLLLEKSPDRTDQAVGAVKTHMQRLFELSESGEEGTSSELDGEHYAFIFEDGSKLVYYPPSKE